MEIELKRDADCNLVAVSGEVSLQHSPDLRRRLLEELKSAKTLVVDLSGVPYIDSSGIATLVEAYKKCRDQDTRFALVGVTAGPLQVLQLTRLDQVFPIFDDVSQAVAQA